VAQIQKKGKLCDQKKAWDAKKTLLSENKNFEKNGGEESSEARARHGSRRQGLQVKRFANRGCR